MDVLRTAVQPITHNLPEPIRDLGISLLGAACYKTLLLDVALDDQACLKLAVSKGLGVGIIAASSIVKVPQILKLLRSKSAAGVSFLSYLLETSAYLISLAYNFRNGFPFSTYGETALILGQNVVISVLVLNYSGRAGLAAVLVAALAVGAGALFTEGVLDMQTMGYLQAGAGVLGVASKLPQIAAIWQQGGTGQLSAFAVGCQASHFSRTITNIISPSGLQLPRRIPVAHLHYPSRGRRQAHPLRLRLRLPPQRDSGTPDGLLLECPFGKGQGEAQGRSHQGGTGCELATKEGTYHSSSRLGFPTACSLRTYASYNLNIISLLSLYKLSPRGLGSCL